MFHATHIGKFNIVCATPFFYRDPRFLPSLEAGQDHVLFVFLVFIYVRLIFSLNRECYTHIETLSSSTNLRLQI